jgi:hypothetical protein
VTRVRRDPDGCRGQRGSKDQPYPAEERAAGHRHDQDGQGVNAQRSTHRKGLYDLLKDSVGEQPNHDHPGGSV